MHNPTKEELDNDPEIRTFVDEIEHDETLMSLMEVEDSDETFDRWDEDQLTPDDLDDDIEYDDDDELDTFERFHDARRRGSWEDE
jgi:hypothetical protein